MIYTLRDYQQGCVDDTLKFCKSKQNYGLSVLPTAAGKSLCIAEIIRQLDNIPTLVLQPTQELLKQNYGKYTAQGGEASLYSASVGKKEISNVTYATPGSVKSLAAKFQHVRLVVIDEAHLMCKKGGMIDKLVNKLHKSVKVVGLTATPLELKSYMGEDGNYSQLNMITRVRPRFWKSIFHVTQVRDLFDRGFLCPTRFTSYDFGMRNVKSRGSDFDLEDVSRVAKEFGVIEFAQKLINESIKRGKKKILVFAPTVNEAKELGRLIPNSAIIDAHTKKKVRAGIVDDFVNGDLRVLLNFSTLCLDTETEILTKAGFKNYKELTYEDEVANWWDDRSITYTNPNKVIVRDMYPEERMISLSSRSLDFRVTDSHDMVMANAAGIPKKIKAGDMVNRSSTSHFTAGNFKPEKFFVDQEVVNKGRFIASNSFNYRKHDGLSMDESKAIAEKGYEEKMKLVYKNPHELTMDECELIGFFLGDGSSSGGRYVISQAMRYTKICKRLDELLESCNITYSKHEKSGKYFTWTLNTGKGSGPQKVDGLHSILPYFVKGGSELYRHFNKEQVRSLMLGFWMAGGDHGNLEKTDNFRVYNTDLGLLNLLQEICITRGFSSNLKLRKEANSEKGWQALYQITFSSRDRIINTIHKNSPAIDEGYVDERVWCVENDSHNIITRRNGKVMVTGNCTGFDAPQIDLIVCLRPTKSYALYYQIYGRGIRIAEGKEVCDFVDLSGNCVTFGDPKDLIFEDLRNFGWGMFVGNSLMSGIPIGQKISKKSLDIRNTLCNFGTKYKGKPFSQVPTYYLEWVKDNFDLSTPWAKKEIVKPLKALGIIN